jgi:transposase
VVATLPDGIALCQEVPKLSGEDGDHDLRDDDWRGSGKGCLSGSRGIDDREPRFRKKLSRQNFSEFTAKQPPALVVMEACGSAHHWAREMIRLGHEVKLIAPRYVKPFVKRQKNDAADAEAIVIAARQPEMRFVEPKGAEQQSRAILFRARERLVHQRTELINALRAALYEYGHVVPQGIRQIGRIAEILEAPHSDLPDLMPRSAGTDRGTDGPYQCADGKDQSSSGRG